MSSIKGFKGSIFSGFTTHELSRVIEKIIVEHPKAAGLYHVSSAPISKFELLSFIKQKLQLEINIIPDESFKCDRSLDYTKFRKEFNYKSPSWEEMIDELCRDIQLNHRGTENTEEKLDDF